MPKSFQNLGKINVLCFLAFSLLELSWAILDVPTTRETPRPGQWGGVRGGVNPSPKGKKGVGRGNSLDHLRPKGLVGLRASPDRRGSGIISSSSSDAAAAVVVVVVVVVAAVAVAVAVAVAAFVVVLRVPSPSFGECRCRASPPGGVRGGLRFEDPEPRLLGVFRFCWASRGLLVGTAGFLSNTKGSV